VVEAVVERRAGDGDAELAGVGEVRQRHAAGLGALAEEDVLGRALQRAPFAYPALERATGAVVGEAVGIEPLQGPCPGEWCQSWPPATRAER